MTVPLRSGSSRALLIRLLRSLSNRLNLSLQVNFQRPEQNSMQIGSDRFPCFLEQLHLCSTRLPRSLWAARRASCNLVRGGRVTGVTQFLICRCIGCLRCFCWLSPTIQIMFVHVQQLRYLRKHLGPVSCWLETLEFLRRWTATLERSVRSADAGTLAFARVYGVWQSRGLSTLRPVCFHGICPNAQPTQGRGAKQREVVNHGHFYVSAQKAALTDC